MEEAIDRIIDFLASCGEADIEAGTGALFGFGSQEDRQAFRAGIRKALESDGLMPVYGSRPADD